MSPRLRGYGSYGAFKNFQKKIHGLQGCGGYEGFIGLLLKIFPYVPEVARFRKLRCFYKLKKKSFGGFISCVVTQSLPSKFSGRPQSYKVTRLQSYAALQFSLENLFEVARLQGYGDKN